MKVLVVDGAVSVYPYSSDHLRQANPYTSFPAEISDTVLEEWGVFEVDPTDAPAYDVTKHVVEDIPALIDGRWKQQWKYEDASPDTITARQHAAELATADTTVKADGFVANFLAMTPAQVEAHVANNSATLAAMRNIVIKLAIIVLVLAKRSLR